MGQTIKTLSALKDIIGTPDLYVRWSRGPRLDAKQGMSRDYQAGCTHSGLSAVPVESDWTDDDRYLSSRMTEYRFLRLKDERISCHLYCADRVGTDSDGYALIKDIKPVAKLSEKLIAELVILKKDWKY